MTLGPQSFKNTEPNLPSISRLQHGAQKWSGSNYARVVHQYPCQVHDAMALDGWLSLACQDEKSMYNGDQIRTGIISPDL